MKPVDPYPSAYATPADLEAARLSTDFERLATAIVASQLRALFADEGGRCSPDAAFASRRPSHRRWLQATLRLLGERGLVATDPATKHLRFAATEPTDALWKRWDAAKAGSGTNDDHRAYLVLIEACLRRLPEILTDAVPATDVMFPGSSMDLVEGIYKHNRIADHFNAVLADSLRAELAEKAARGGRGMRLLEIGAGTGGTTAALMPMLRGFGDLVEEYCYTDLSRAFLLHAEEAYKPQFPPLRTALFDVGKALAAQSIEGDRYDAVIATNVLHAPPSIRETLRNAKALLKRGGTLLVNEISEWSWHTHFTFGLLEGWWLYEDASLRLAGSPGLSPARWERLLKAERFLDIRFPAREHHGLGQQIIVARSDGVVRQRLVAPTATTAPSATTTTTTATATATKPARTSSRVVPPTASRTSVTTARTGAASTLASDDSALREACAALFRETIAGALRMEACEIETHKPLEHYGLDSILVVQLTTRFRKLFPGVRSTLFFEVQSIDGLVQHFLANDRAALLSMLAARGGEHGATSVATKPGSSPVSAAPVTSERVARRRFATRRDAAPALPVQASIPMPTPSVDHVTSFDVAVIGVSGRYPQAPDLERFWENLSSGRDCASEIPADRWRWQDHYDPEKGKAGKSYTKWGGFLEDIDKFDPLFFRIAPKEAKRIDPQERLFLETSYHAIEDSGYTPDTLATAGKVGVFVGVMNSRYTVQPLYYSIANRVSFLLDFSGPSFAVDSACSSSLTAIHLALDSLRGGLCDVAIAGAVSLILDPQHMLELTAVGMLSEGAYCRSFGRNADGFVDAEGVGAVVLKPLTHAIRDGDNIQAVIRGSALNAGGRTHGYTVPNPAAQAQVVSAALERAQVDSAEVSYVEAHGTGTALGDPIEVAGLTRAFRSSRRAAGDAGPAQHCAIGSLKSNIGHCESAAGIAALTKVLLQLRHGQLVPTLHADVVNDEIDFSATPFRLQRELAPWRRMALGEGSGTREIPRIAGISSFGAGGANAHLVVQEPPVVDADAIAGRGPDAAGACIVPLSARTPQQLQDKIRQLLAFLRRRGADIGLHDVAYTLQVGREAMDERIALVVDSMDDLQRQLHALSHGLRLDPEPPRASARQHKDFVAACMAAPEFGARLEGWLARCDHARLAEHWAKGVDIDWSRLYPGARRRRISLPTYPFARERHWIEPQRSLGHGHTTVATHPLLQRNTSTLRYPEYSVELKGDERFLDEDAAGRRSLSFLMCIEMARAAIAAVYPDDLASRELRFEEVVADDAIRIEAACELHIALLPDGEDALRFEIFSMRDSVERVHCQGIGRFMPTDVPAPAGFAAFAARLTRAVPGEMFYGRIASLGLVDRPDRRVVRRIARADREVVLEYAVDEASDQAPWGLRPAILASIEQGIVWWLDEAGVATAQPFEWRIHAAGALRLHAASDRQGYLVLRCTDMVDGDTGESEWEAELYDTLGRPCLRATGLRLERVADRRATLPGDAVASDAVPEARAETEREAHVQRATSPGPRATGFVAKPSAVGLSAVDDVGTSVATARVDRPVVSLPPSSVELRELGQGVYAVAIAQATLDRPVIEGLLQALDHVRQRPDAKALLLEGTEPAFLHGERASLENAIHAGLYRALVELPVPTIAAMRGDASGAGFLLGALCDFMVCGQESRYSFSDTHNGIRPTPAENDLLARRFGEAWANDLLFISGPQLGRGMSAKGWTFPIAENAQVMPTALALAQDIAAKGHDSLRLLKRHMAHDLLSLVARLGDRGSSHGESVENEDAPVPTTSRQLPDAREGISVEWLSERVVSIRLRDSGDGAEPAALLRNLRASLDDLALSSGAAGGAAALVLRSEHRDFLPAIDAVGEQELLLLRDALSNHPVPVIAAFEHDADGAGWLLGLCADACVYGERGKYSSEGLWRHPSLLRLAAPLLDQRLGGDLAKRFLFDSDAATGIELASGAGIVASGGPDGILSAARALAESSPLRSTAVLKQWRSRPARRVEDDVAGQGRPVADGGDAGRRAAAVPMPTSPVIETDVRDNGVIVVRMVEREAKNMFSPALIRGLEDVFAHIHASDAYRAVVLCGYDTYFACGGTRESLLAIQQGKARFTDTRLYQLPMTCPIPVIAAMQGHAIGGGWSLGMFADIRLFSAESRYISPYMRYGFTPGAGSTLVFPATLGLDLARHTLFTAAEHTGRGLKATGLRDACIAREDVLPRALALADAIATRPVGDVAVLKRYFSAPWLAAIEDTYARELAMHEQSFVGKEHALDGVMRHFLDEAPAPPVVNEPVVRRPMPVASEDVSAAQDVSATSDITDELKALLAAELQMRVDDVDAGAPFVDLGLDSITGVTWVRKINERYGTRIEATKIYSHPTLAEFSRFVDASRPTRAHVPPRIARTTQRVAPVIPAPPATADASRPAAKSARVRLRQGYGGQGMRSWRTRGPGRRAPAIAVIGMAGQFPHARNLDEFWRNIAVAKDCIDTVPPQRWDIERYFSDDISVPGTTNSRWMGVLEDCDAFDPLFFNISPTEAESMDPQQRLMLQNCWHAIEDAAIDPRSLSGSRCGVFIGCGATDYHQRSREHQFSTQGFTGASMSILAARISYFLNLQGPCLSIDTACSSSLIAIANACDSLVVGDCDMALAGGVAVMAGPMMHVKTGQSGMLSVDGRCFAFDHRANGFVPSEGVGAVMLKRLADAERDGDIIHATIRGWGINQDGKTNGITAPNPVSQTRLMRGIYDKYGVDPEEIQLVEAHGTGTTLGDPIEVEGLNQAFRHYTPKTQYCVLGSVKGNVGHCLYAAGIAGVMKVVLAMKHGQLPPAANFERRNPHIDLADTPFLINAELRPWPVNAKGSRTAVVSSFGFSGTNAHLVLEAPPQVRRGATRDEESPRPALIPLSARSPEQLRQRAQDLAAFVARADDGGDTTPALRDIAYTLQVGREAMEERWAIVARSTRDLAERLRAFASGDVPKGMHVGSIHARSTKLAFIGQDGTLQDVLVETCLRDGKLDKLAELWVDGLDLPWEKLHRDAGCNGRRPRRIALPLYPFAKERYWLEDDTSIAIPAPAGAASAIHPLLHANVSTLRQQCYRTTLGGDEFFLRDHRVRVGDGRVEKVLPGVAYLEMAAAAISHALPEQAALQRLVLSDIVWWRPVVVAGPVSVEIELGVDASGTILFEIASGTGDDRVLHCQGEAGYVDAADDRKVDAATLASATSGERWDAGDIYAAFEQVGLHYGSAHRGLRTLSRVGGRVVARVSRPAIPGDNGPYRMHPGVMDAALQACIGFLPSLHSLPKEPSVPFALRSLTIHAPCPPEVDVVLTPLAGAASGAPIETCDVSIHGPDGALCVEIQGFSWRAVDRRAASSPGTLRDTGHASGTPVSDDVSDDVSGETFDETFYRELLDSISKREVSAEEAAEFGLLP